ncbi:hypothetical protein GCM10025793_00360 [Lysobacter lycopersici]
MANAVAAIAAQARDVPARAPVMRRTMAASSAATSAIQLHWRPVTNATSAQAAAMPALASSNRAMAGKGSRRAAGTGIVRTG